MRLTYLESCFGIMYSRCSLHRVFTKNRVFLTSNSSLQGQIDVWVHPCTRSCEERGPAVVYYWMPSRLLGLLAAVGLRSCPAADRRRRGGAWVNACLEWSEPMSMTHCVHSSFARGWSSLPGLRGAKHIVGSDNKPAFQVSSILRGLLCATRTCICTLGVGIRRTRSVVVRWPIWSGGVT